MTDNKECTFVGSRFYVTKKMYGTNNIKFVSHRGEALNFTVFKWL
jgi:hypothetical protein